MRINYQSLNRPKTFLEKCKFIWNKLHLDFPLIMGLLILITFGLIILYSAGNKSSILLYHQVASISIAFFIMFILAQIPPHRYSDMAPWIFGFVAIMLAAVLGIGVISKGAQRWLNLGLFRFQPSELMKLAMPLMLAWYLKDKILPLEGKTLLISIGFLLIPVLMIAKQPDLGTAIIVLATGIFVLLLAGIRLYYLISSAIVGGIGLPILWHFMHTYQKNRILIFINPERDPLGTGYNIIQSKIAIGSGGLFGKGLFQGTQAHLQFLPTHTTDFIFAVCGEELGLFGCLMLLTILLGITIRCLYISSRSQDNFTRLLTGSLSLTFFISFFVNIGMVIGLLPVVGIPLPLVSYGGTSLVTLLGAFGIIMSVYTHRKLLGI